MIGAYPALERIPQKLKGFCGMRSISLIRREFLSLERIRSKDKRANGFAL
jgi:hypothetical protein